MRNVNKEKATIFELIEKNQRFLFQLYDIIIKHIWYKLTNTDHIF